MVTLWKTRNSGCRKVSERNWIPSGWQNTTQNWHTTINKKRDNKQILPGWKQDRNKKNLNFSINRIYKNSNHNYYMREIKWHNKIMTNTVYFKKQTLNKT